MLAYELLFVFRCACFGKIVFRSGSLNTGVTGRGRELGLLGQLCGLRVEKSMDESSGQNADIDWKKCILCQQYTSEKIECPANSKQSNRGAGYFTLQRDLLGFCEAGELHLDLAKLDEGEGIAATLLRHKASWHKSCRVQYNATKLKRLENKRKQTEENASQQTDGSGKRMRSDIAGTPVALEVCFFFGGPATEGHPLSRTSTTELDSRLFALLPQRSMISVY